MAELALVCGHYDAPDSLTCDGIPVALILTERQVIDADDPEVYSWSAVTAFPVCADHAPEEVHETRASMDPSEFRVVNL